MSNLDFLASVPAFRDLSIDEQRWLDDRLKSRSFKQGEIIVREGDPAEEAYVLQRGEVQVRRHQGGELASLHPTDVFGEIALVDHRRRSATLVAVTAAECLVVPKRAFQTLLEQNHAFSLSMLRLVLTRLAELEASAR